MRMGGTREMAEMGDAGVMGDAGMMDDAAGMMSGLAGMSPAGMSAAGMSSAGERKTTGGRCRQNRYRQQWCIAELHHRLSGT